MPDYVCVAKIKKNFANKFSCYNNYCYLGAKLYEDEF